MKKREREYLRHRKIFKKPIRGIYLVPSDKTILTKEDLAECFEKQIVGKQYYNHVNSQPHNRNYVFSFPIPFLLFSTLGFSLYVGSFIALCGGFFFVGTAIYSFANNGFCKNGMMSVVLAFLCFLAFHELSDVLYKVLH